MDWNRVVYHYTYSSCDSSLDTYSPGIIFEAIYFLASHLLLPVGVVYSDSFQWCRQVESAK